MRGVLVAILVLPAVAACLSAVPRPRVAQAATVAASIGTFALSLVMVGPAVDGAVSVGAWLRVDALSEVFLVAVAFVYATAAVYSVGYLRSEEGSEDFPRYARRFYVGINLFAWSMLCVPIVNDLALVWVAIEITTVVSALLVAIEDTDDAAEAAWKYILIASVGLAVALLGTIFMYAAGSHVFGPAYEPYLTRLQVAAPAMPETLVKLAYVLAVLGFGTKMGLVPVHTWLPDAHAEAPTPVSAMLSGALLVVSFYAILRFHQVAVRALGPAFPRNVLLVFGVASLLLAALFVLDQRNVKRLLAYSSVEHMGILAVGTAFGTPIALVGVLLHVLAHAAAKGTAFFGAGAFVRKFGTKSLGAIRGGIDVLPWSGSMFLLAVLALSALPPFGIFRSEFLIVSGGLSGGQDAAAAILVVLVTIAFLGLASYGNRMTVLPAREGLARGEVSLWMVVPMVAGILGLLLLGLHPPAELLLLLQRGAAVIGGTR